MLDSLTEHNRPAPQLLLQVSSRPSFTVRSDFLVVCAKVAKTCKIAAAAQSRSFLGVTLRMGYVFDSKFNSLFCLVSLVSPEHDKYKSFLGKCCFLKRSLNNGPILVNNG